MIERLKLLDEKSKLELRNYLTRTKQVVFPRTIENFLGALDSIFQSEIKNRRYQLADKLGRSEDIKEKFRRKEKKYHEQSIQRIDTTLRIFKAERKIIKPEKLKKMDEVIKDKELFKEIREKSIEALEDTFLEGSEDPNSAMEVIEIFSDVFKKVEERGEVNGLFDYMEEQLEELKRVRSEEKDRGREKYSPLPWHKIVALSLLLGGIAVIVIACFVTSRITESWVVFWGCVFGSITIADPVIKWVIKILAWC